MKLSVLLPMHNCSKYVHAIMESLRTQTFPQQDMEIIVYLDGCNDDTHKLVAKYIVQHPHMNIRKIVSKKNMGVSVARNSLAASAIGEYIHFIDCDDVINTDFYSLLYTAATDTDSDMAVASYTNEHWPTDSVTFSRQDVLTYHQDKISHTRVDVAGYSWRYLIRRTFWNNNKFAFPTDLKYIEDLPLMTQMVYYSNHIVTVPGAVYTYKHRRNSILTSRSNKNITHQCYIRARHRTDSFLSVHGIIPSVIPKHCAYLRMFDFIPFIVVRYSDNGNRIKWRLFGILPIFTWRRKTYVRS